MKPLLIWPCLLACASLLLAGCNEQSIPVAQGWSPPVKVGYSEDGLGGGVFLYKWHGTLAAWQAMSDGTRKSFLMNRDSDSWVEGRLTGLPPDTLADPVIDQNSDRVFFEQASIENDHFLMNLFVVRLTGSAELQTESKRGWATDKRSLFGETRPNVKLNAPYLGQGMLNGSELYIPYSLIGEKVSFDDSLFDSGVFHSSDSGMTWQKERVSDFEAYDLSVCKSKAYYYYFVAKLARNQGMELLFSRKKVEAGSWDVPKPFIKTFANAYGRHVTVAEDDIVHFCWLDSRHEKRRLNAVYPNRQNYEVAYCHRKDSDADWSKDVILSKGLLYSYSPSISVEADRIVVAWAGVRTAKDGHGESDPNDIYFITSTDGGKTWSTLLKATGGAKDGITSGKPQVMLLNGVIHLFYIQGKMNLKEESPGLTKLNQPPWPIYYQQRPFPN